MKIKKITALILALLLFSLAFVACKKDEPKTEESSNTDPVVIADSLKNYTIIRSESQSDVATMCMKLSNAIGTLVGDKISVRNDEAEAVDDSKYEILVGDTNRPQSAEAKAKLQDLAYSITKNGNKIVIVASNNLILEDAVNYFIDNTKKLDSGELEYPTDHSNSDYQALDLLTNGKANYQIVFTDFYNNLNKHSDKNDYTQGFTKTKARYIVDELKKLTSISFTYESESKASASQKKIIVGKPAGDTNTYFDYYESGIQLKDGNIYIYGHNHEGIELAVNNFITRVNLYNKIEKGKFSILCHSDGYKWTNSDIKYDIPLPKDIQYEGAYTAANNGIYFVYENCEKAAFDAYCADLKTAGFTQYFDRKASTNAFAGFYKGEDAAWIYYISSRKEFRIVFENYQPLPNIETEGTKVQEPYVTQIGVSYADDDEYTTNKSTKYAGTGMGYIIGLEDGRYIVIDGNTQSSDKTSRATEYYNYLKDNNKRTDGKIVIAAWIITHAHNDHYKNYEQFGKNYGSQVECQYIIHNLPTELTLWGAANFADKYYIQNHAKIDTYFKGATVYTVHTGYAATIGGVYLEFMSTYEDLYNNNDLISYKSDPSVPNCIDEMNDTCLTFRFTFKKGTNDEAKVFFLADNYYDHGERLASMWDKDYMKSDAVQVAHHGWGNGVTSNTAAKHNDNIQSGKSSTYAAIRATYGFYSNYNYHMTKYPTVSNIIKSYRPNAKFYCNTAADGSAANYTMTFNGGIKVTETKKS